MLCHDNICVGDGRDTAHFGAFLVSGAPGGVEADEEGRKTARNLGRRVAQLAIRLAHTPDEPTHAPSYSCQAN